MKAAIEKLNVKAIREDGYKVTNYTKRCIAFDTLKVRLKDSGEFNIETLYSEKGFAFIKELCGSLMTIPFDYDKLDVDDYSVLYEVERLVVVPLNYGLAEE